jgi:undecaprenyl-diphosphatase
LGSAAAWDVPRGAPTGHEVLSHIERSKDAAPDVGSRFMRPRIPTKLIAGLPGSPRLWVMLCVASALVFGFAEVVDDVFDDPADGDTDAGNFDRTFGHFVQSFRSDMLTQVAINLTSLGSSSVLLVFALLAYAAVLAGRDRVGFLHLTLALLGAFLFPEALKGYFARERPDALLHLVPVRTLSFPSGHSFGAAACYATFAFFFARYVARRSIEIFCYVLAALIVGTIGLTRIYLGVHYPTDVLGGLSAGGAWAFFLDAVFSPWYRKPPAALQSPQKISAT